MSAPVSLIPELEEVVQHGSPERRAETLKRITAFFLDGASRFNDDHVRLFDEVFSRLIAEIESKARTELSQRLSRAVGGSVKVIPGGPTDCERIGVVTGGAGGDLKIAAAEGVDTFITGEGPHWTFAQAEELGLNVLYGGHYATETFGVKALAAELSRRFKLPLTFIDYPTGL